MEPIDKLVAGLKHVDSLIAEDVLEPDLGRSDWSTMRARAKLLYDAVQTDVLGALDDTLFNVQEEEVIALVKRRVAGILAEAAAPIFGSGDTKSFLSLMSKASQLAPDAELRALYDAGSAEPELFCCFQHARWLQRKDRFSEADASLKRVMRETEKPALKSAAKKARSAPRPITSAPSLFRLNGCGTGLYGERDPGPDGSYIATYCICLLWIPILPLTAYRVRKVDSTTYQFGSKEVLGPIARAWQVMLLAGALLAGGWGAVSSYLESPTHRAEVAIKEAKAAEAAGDSEGAVQRFKDAVRTFDGSADVTAAAEAVVRLTAAGVAEPATPASVDQISRVVNSFYELPSVSRSGSPAAQLVTKLCAWADQIGDATPAQSSAALSVLDMAAKVGKDGGGASPVDERLSKLRRSIADKVASERPLLALQHYTQINDAAAVDASKVIIDSFGDGPSLWIEAEPSVDRFADAAAALGRGAEAAAARGKLKDAAAALAGDKVIIEGADEKALMKALLERSGHQEIAVAVASIRRGRGDLKGALATLAGLGEPGRLTADAQQLLGQCYADAGDLEKADAVLSALLSERLPVFQQAQREYMNAAQKLRELFVRDAKLGVMPRELEDRLRSAPEAEQPAIFADYLRGRMDADSGLAVLRADYLRNGAVVQASLTLGMVKLRRAREAGGDAQRALLDDAERAFLSIRQEAEGQPSFHLGLGQVYHRLGRAVDGDKELQGVLDRKDDDLGLAVAHVYRELGQVSRAKQISEQVYESASSPVAKHAAALLRAHIYDDRDDQETWLRRCDTTSPIVQNMLEEAQAARLAEEGKLGEADRAYAKVILWHERDAKSDPAAANNAAIAYMKRYTLTGDIAHIKSAVAHLETSVRLSGDNAILLGHLSDALEYLGMTRAAGAWVQTRTLMLESGDVTSLLDSMLEGPKRAEVLDALAKEPSYRRALEIEKQEQILAPQKVSAYLKQSRWLRWNRDTAGLAELDKRLAAMPAMSSQDVTEGRRAWQSGEKDEEIKRAGVERIARARERLARAQKDSDKPTLGSAWMVLADALAMQVYWDAAPAIMDERVKACQSAREAWPEGVPETEISGSLMVAAVLKASSESAALGKLWVDERRTHGVTVILHHALAAKGAEEIIAALRKQPELGEAARMRKASMGDRPSMGDWMLARAMGDAEMEQAASKVFERLETELTLKIEARLFAGQPREKAELDLFTSKGRAGAQ